MGKWMIETERLYLREMKQDDYDDLAKMLKSSEVMLHYAHEFTDGDVQAWLDRQFDRYEKDGFGLWAVCLKETGKMIGQCGITWQEWDGCLVPEIAYFFQQKYWGEGYAIEAAKACRDYAFEQLAFDKIYSMIRDTNAPSQKVATRNGMRQQGSYVKNNYGVDMRILVFSVKKNELTY